MQFKKEQKKDNAAAAGIAGAVIGAGVALAATKALSDKKTRAQIKQTASQVKGKVSKMIEDAKKRTAETKKEAGKKVEEKKKEVEENI